MAILECGAPCFKCRKQVEFKSSNVFKDRWYCAECLERAVRKANKKASKKAMKKADKKMSEFDGWTEAARIVRANES